MKTIPVSSPEARRAAFRQKVHNKYNGPSRNTAYLCMEFGLHTQLPIYSGGLGILAGDTMKSAADLDLPLVGVGNLYRDGYFKQSIDATTGRQIESPHLWDPNQSEDVVDLQQFVTVPMFGQDINFRLWGSEVAGHGGGFVPLFLLDSRGADNPEYFGETLSKLYDPAGGEAKRIMQDMALGIGGVRALKELELNISRYQLNEGHGAFAVVAELKRFAKYHGINEFGALTQKHFQAVANLFAFTTHTPVEAGFDRFPVSLVEGAFTDTFLRSAILKLGRDPKNRDFISMAHLAMRLAGFRNGVAQLHAEVSRELFPEYPDIFGITNGVHHLTWTEEATQKLFDKHCKEWRSDPEKLAELSDNGDFRDGLWPAHQTNKTKLLTEVKKRTGIEMDSEILTLGFARRFATYKRGNLIFQNEDELLKIAEDNGGLQIVMAGKAHPADNPGKEIIAMVNAAGKRLTERSKGKIKFVFLENYDMDLGLLLTAGVDVWLNTPIRPHEASGTSG
ncbi:MAG: alpha-glucan family phosphorylase, partial [Candidatus Saganbacteria bacterium]|nr:alpha-glucan family phosphorylase [Candidatus Saganbacteria bacterium]